MEAAAEGPDDETSLDAILNLLEEQYQSTLEYCNATTALYNALQQSTRSLDRSPNAVRRATQDHVQAVQRLHATMRKLYDCTHQYCGWADHVDRSRRILATIATQHGTLFHAHGIPFVTATAPTSGTKLVALATLRASIQRVQEQLQAVR